MKFSVLIITVILVFNLISTTYCDEWPDWRGPNRDGTWHETGVMKKFASPHIQKKWKVAVSSGYSGPTVAARRVYITDRLTKPKEIERVLCFNAMTGDMMWSY
ncbi:dehydrogenase, partial [Candidatus Latescibacterota bacterium]